MGGAPRPIRLNRERTLQTLMLVPRAMPRVVLALIALWESYQVELRGSYSVARLEELAAAHERISFVHTLATTLLTPLPCIIASVLADVLPLKPPEFGLKAQGAAYWVRSFVSVAIITITSLSQFYHSSSRLILRTPWAVVITLVVPSITMVVFLGLHIFIGFPTPFLYQVATWFWHALMVFSMWTIWKRTLRTDVEARKDLQRFVWCWLSQQTMIFIYPIFSYVFRTLSDRHQTWFSFFLPFWKLALKVWASYGVFRVEDSAPVYVVFTVDVFHAMFLSCAMQSSSNTGPGALVVIMSVDVFQNCLALHYVWVISCRLKRLGQTIKPGSQSSSKSITVREAPLFQAAAIVASLQAVRDHPTIAGSRHERLRQHTFSQIAPVEAQATNVPSRGRTSSPTQRDLVQPTIESHGKAGEIRRGFISADPVSLQFVRETLRLLHMVEFYILVEFTEVFVACVYTTYLVIMSRLPNRAYYLQLRDMTTDQWTATVRHVMLYAALELLSFGVLDLALRHLLHHSPIRQLAFVLRKHWRLVQSLVVLWVFIVIQMSLEHLGNVTSFVVDGRSYACVLTS